jgi:hypothetical protein
MDDDDDDDDDDDGADDNDDGADDESCSAKRKSRGLMVVGKAQAKAPTNPRLGGYAADVRYTQPRVTLPLYRRTVSLDTLNIPADSHSSPCLDVRDVTK